MASTVQSIEFMVSGTRNFCNYAKKKICIQKLLTTYKKLKLKHLILRINIDGKFASNKFTSMNRSNRWIRWSIFRFVSADWLIDLKGIAAKKIREMSFGRECVPGACVGGGGGGFGLFPNVVNAVELTPKSTMKTEKSIVRLPHCVNRFNGCILNMIIWYVLAKGSWKSLFRITLVRCVYSRPKNALFFFYFFFITFGIQ